MTKWLTYERVCQVVSYNPETGVVRRLDGKPEPHGGYIKLPADCSYVPKNWGHNFIEIDCHRFWIHTVVRLILRGQGRVPVTGKYRPKPNRTPIAWPGMTSIAIH